MDLPGSLIQPPNKRNDGNGLFTTNVTSDEAQSYLQSKPVHTPAPHSTAATTFSRTPVSTVRIGTPITCLFFHLAGRPKVTLELKMRQFEADILRHVPLFSEDRIVQVILRGVVSTNPFSSYGVYFKDEQNLHQNFQIIVHGNDPAMAIIRREDASRDIVLYESSKRPDMNTIAALQMPLPQDERIEIDAAHPLLKAIQKYYNTIYSQKDAEDMFNHLFTPRAGNKVQATTATLRTLQEKILNEEEKSFMRASRLFDFSIEFQPIITRQSEYSSRLTPAYNQHKNQFDKTNMSLSDDVSISGYIEINVMSK